jgi:poly(ADP-ribose) glycohydrolase ARH3
MPDLADRFRGVMVGTVVGDCLGRPMEGSREPDLAYIDEMVERLPMLSYSDDTVMTIELAESLLERGGFDGADMGRRFAEAWHEEPHRGYGSNIVHVFNAVLRGVPWDEAAARQFGGEGSFGNGGAMRVSPVALWAYPDLEETVRLAQQTSRVTHTHPVGIEGAVIQAVAVLHALRDDFDPHDLLGELDRLMRTERFRGKLAILPTCLERGDDEYVRLHLGNWVAADKSVLTALYAFLMADGFEDAVRRAIRLGGDTDTIGAMAAAMAGARWGHSSIPESWLGVEGSERLERIGDRLATRIGV